MNIFDPELIVVGGGFGAAAGELVLEPAREAARREAIPPADETLRVVPAELGAEAGLVGAGLVAFEALDGSALMPLAVCATPIGNLDDVTLRVLEELREADVVLCEDTRRTRILLDAARDRRAPARATTATTRRRGRRRVLERLLAGERVALVSDAGLPGVNDPGARLIAAAVAAGVEVTVLPGASAVETALVASGLAARSLPVRRVPAAPGWRAPRAGRRRLRGWAGAVVAFESPRRLPASLRRARRGAAGSDAPPCAAS